MAKEERDIEFRQPLLAEDNSVGVDASHDKIVAEYYQVSYT